MQHSIVRDNAMGLAQVQQRAGQADSDGQRGQVALTALCGAQALRLTRVERVQCLGAPANNLFDCAVADAHSADSARRAQCRRLARRRLEGLVALRQHLEVAFGQVGPRRDLEGRALSTAGVRA